MTSGDGDGGAMPFRTSGGGELGGGGGGGVLSPCGGELGGDGGGGVLTKNLQNTCQVSMCSRVDLTKKWGWRWEDRESKKWEMRAPKDGIGSRVCSTHGMPGWHDCMCMAAPAENYSRRDVSADGFGKLTCPTGGCSLPPKRFLRPTSRGALVAEKRQRLLKERKATRIAPQNCHGYSTTARRPQDANDGR